MKNTTHTCKATGCNRQVPKRYLMCRKHWYQVPQPIRDAVWAEWANVQTTGQMSIAYARAVRDAINAIERTYPLDDPPQIQAQSVDQF